MILLILQLILIKENLSHRRDKSLSSLLDLMGLLSLLRLLVVRLLVMAYHSRSCDTLN